MALYAVPDIISSLLLCFVFFLLIRQRAQFESYRPFAWAVILFAFGRMSDAGLEVSFASLTAGTLLQRPPFELALANGGNACDLIGIFLLVFGFLKTIRHQQQEEKRIAELEQLLPLCAWCKKYRTAEGVWKPIEEFLLDNRATQITHGICPECAAQQTGMK
jgi:hypothetical protein